MRGRLGELAPPLAAASRAAAGDGPAWLVGGAVRDHLLGLGGGVTEADIVILASVSERAATVAAALREATTEEPTIVVHGRFGTATVAAGPWRVDLSVARKETYPTPGKLPEVSFPATLKEDLGRRDFTVNAMTARLLPTGGWEEPVGPGLADIAGAPGGSPLWRVFHPGSFVDDPTRLFRLARYRRRLGGRLAPATRLALDAPGLLEAFSRVAPARWRAEVEAWTAHGLPAGLDRARSEESVLRRLFGGSWEAGVGGSFAGLLAACRGPEAVPVWQRLGGTKRELAMLAPLADPDFPGFGADVTPAAADPFLASLGPVALAVARQGPSGEAVERWEAAVARLKMPAGDDLLALGIPEGPEVAEHLAAAREAALEGRAEPAKESLLAWIRGRIAGR